DGSVPTVTDRPGECPADVYVVKLTVRTNSPLSVGLQFATVSTSKNPGWASTSSPAVWIVIDVRSSREGFVAEIPRGSAACRASARYRSIVAADIANSSARTSGE